MAKMGIYEQAKRYPLAITLDLLGYDVERQNILNGIMPTTEAKGYNEIKDLAKSYRE